MQTFAFLKIVTALSKQVNVRHGDSTMSKEVYSRQYCMHHQNLRGGFELVLISYLVEYKFYLITQDSQTMMAWLKFTTPREAMASQKPLKL